MKNKLRSRQNDGIIQKWMMMMAESSQSNLASRKWFEFREINKHLVSKRKIAGPPEIAACKPFKQQLHYYAIE